MSNRDTCTGRSSSRSAFASTLLGFGHEPVVAWIFMLALGLMSASLFNFAPKVRLSLDELKLYR